MEQNKDYRNRTTHIGTNDFGQTFQRQVIRERIVISTSGALGTIGHPCAKYWILICSFPYKKKLA